MILSDVFIKTDKNIVGKNGGEYSLVLPENPNAYEKKAAEEFNFLLEKSVGVKLPAMCEADFSGKGIFLGNTERATNKLGEISFGDYGSDGFKIISDGNDLIIAGVDRGTLFGVYKFFERAAGYIYYAEGDIKIDSLDELKFYECSVFEKPDIDARSFGYYDCYHIGFPDVEKNADRLFVSRNNYSDWITAGHTYFQIIPKSEYEKYRPDWYSKDGNNLCLTADGLVEEFSENVAKMIISSNGGRYFMIGQEDNFGFCDCERCKKAEKTYGGKSAVMMKFSNAVARSVKDKLKGYPRFNDIKLVTFAYNATSEPPVRYDENKKEFLPLSDEVKAEDNLAVMCVPFGTLHNYPYTHPKNECGYKALKGWSACAKSLFVWDYCVNFDNYLVDFNDYDVIAENYRFFKEIGVDFLFDQGSYNSKTPCFDELKLYLHSRLAWDSSLNTEELIDDFCKEYYKDIAEPVKEYLTAVRNRWKYISAKYGEDVRSGGMDSSYYLLPQFFPKDYLYDCFEIFTRARGILETIRIEEWDKYILLKKRLKKLSIGARFLFIKIYGRLYGNELPVKINSLRADMNEFGIVMTNEGNFLEIC